MASERPRVEGEALHHLGNQLQVILGFIELIIADTSPDHRYYEELVEIRNAALKAVRLIGRPDEP